MSVDILLRPFPSYYLHVIPLPTTTTTTTSLPFRRPHQGHHSSPTFRSTSWSFFRCFFFKFFKFCVCGSFNRFFFFFYQNMYLWRAARIKGSGCMNLKSYAAFNFFREFINFVIFASLLKFLFFFFSCCIRKKFSFLNSWSFPLNIMVFRKRFSLMHFMIMSSLILKLFVHILFILLR